MMRFLLILFVSVWIYTNGFSQSQFPDNINQTLEQFQNKNISRTKALQIIREKISLRSANENQLPLKCATPILTILKATGDEIQTNTPSTPSVSASFYTSPSGKFRFEYETTGIDAVLTADLNSNGIPDYVETAGIEMDKIWNYQVAHLGFRDPLENTNPYPIQFKRLDYYGHTEFNGKKIVINSTFKNFPPNTDPAGNVIGALKATLAHEFKHAIQYRYNSFSGDSHRWAEMDATLMEEMTFTEVNDYYNYLPTSGSIFRNPEQSIDPGSYEDVSFAIYFFEKFGEFFWPNTWARIGSGTPQFLQSLNLELNNNGTSLETEFPQIVLWHFYTGSRTKSGFGFSEAAHYPTTRHSMNKAINLQGSMTQLSDDIHVTRLAFQIISVLKSSSSGKVNTGLFTNSSPVSGIFATKEADDFYLSPIPAKQIELFRTDKDWAQTDTLFILVPGTVSNQTDISVKVLNMSDIQQGVYSWGDADLSGTVNNADVRTLMQSILNDSPLPKEAAWASDVSLNQKISGLDASEILKVVNGKQSVFEYDFDSNGLMPESNMFRSAFLFNEDTASNDSLILSLSPLNADATSDTKIGIKLSYSGEAFARSILFDLPFDSSNLNVVSADLDAYLTNAELDYTQQGSSLKIMLVNDEPIPPGALMTLSFNRKNTSITGTSFSLAHPIVDEYSEVPFRSYELTTKIPTELGVGIESPDFIANTFRIVSLFPNPFNPEIAIRFAVPEYGQVKIELYNTIGQKVKTITHQEYQVGAYTIPFNGSQLASGVYILSFHFKGDILFRKITLLK